MALPCMALPYMALPYMALPCMANGACSRSHVHHPWYLDARATARNGMALPCMAWPCMALPCMVVTIFSITSTPSGEVDFWAKTPTITPPL